LFGFIASVGGIIRYQPTSATAVAWRGFTARILSSAHAHRNRQTLRSRPVDKPLRMAGTHVQIAHRPPDLANWPVAGRSAIGFLQGADVITKRSLQIGVAGWLLVVGIPTEQTIARSRLNNFAPFTMSSALAQVEGSSEGVAQKPDEPPELSPEESAERQRLRDLQAAVDAAIAKYFSSKPSERKGGSDRWYCNGDYLHHVLGVSAMAIISPDTTLPPRERFRGDQIGVEVDMDENIGEVERQLPSKLDGVPVEVYPMPTGVAF